MVDVPGYRIQELLSWGAQGDVFLAHALDGTPVALKVVTADRGDGDPDALLRLEREAKLLAAVDSPHVVRVREFVRGADWRCLVLEFLSGQRLDAAVRERAGQPAPAVPVGDETVKVPADPQDQVGGRQILAPTEAAPPLCTRAHVDWALGVAVQIASGAAALHRIGLVHRDLKPQNVMIVGARAVLIDFGFARMDGITTLTQTGTAIGTLAYMSPEQLRGGPATPRGDVFAIGASIWHCLTGMAPGGRDHRILTGAVRKRVPDKVRRCNSAVDPSLATVVARCLEPDPRDRYQDAAALLADLTRCQAGAVVRPPFSVARLWRHHGRFVVAGSLLAAMVSILFAWISAFDARAIASSIRDDVLAQQPLRALATWQDCQARRQQVIDALNAQLPEPGAAASIARALGLGLLAVSARPGHRIALIAAGGDQGDLPAVGAFVDLEAARALLAPPGLTWCFLMATDPGHWWAADDPRCLHLLVRTEVPDGPIVPRSLQALPPAIQLALVGETVPVECGEYRIDGNGAAARVRIEAPLQVMRHELSRAALTDFRLRLGGQASVRAELDAWLRHPDEPEAVADELWAMWQSTRAEVADASLPALVSFWEAHRLAAYSGYRLPFRREWQVIAGDDGKSARARERRVVPDVPSPVDANPGWDVTGRGFCFANSNVSEWTLDRDPRLPLPSFLIVPVQIGLSGVRTFDPGIPIVRGTSAHQLHGVRLYRHRLPLR